MEKLFKCNTVKQRKIMEWLVNQGITSADVFEAKLNGPAMVRITNPAGQYMDVYCNDAYQVRILDVTEEREEVLNWAWSDSATWDDDEYRDWYGNLTADEAAMVDQWDARYCQGIQKLAQAILDQQEQNQNAVHETDYSPEM